MQYSPHLKKCMFELEEVIKRYDVAAVITIHTPGNSEYLLRLDPDYSCAKLVGDKLRIRAKLEDFKGDQKARDKKLADTSNMFKLLTETTVNTIYPLIEVSEQLDARLGAEHKDGGHTSQTTQNN